MTSKNLYAAFLRERKLGRAFRTYKTLQRRKKTYQEVALSNYDGTRRRTRIILTKENRKTVIRDFNSLKVLLRSRRDISDVMKGLGKKFKDAAVFDVKTKKGKWSIKNEFKKGELNLKNDVTVESWNETLGRNRKIHLTNSPGKKFGFASIDATYYASDGTRKRVQARSHGGFNLQTQRREAVDDALKNGAAVAEFSPVDVVIHEYWFEVWTDYYPSRKSRGW